MFHFSSPFEIYIIHISQLLHLSINQMFCFVYLMGFFKSGFNYAPSQWCTMNVDARKCPPVLKYICLITHPSGKPKNQTHYSKVVFKHLPGVQIIGLEEHISGPKHIQKTRTYPSSPTVTWRTSLSSCVTE